MKRKNKTLSFFKKHLFIDWKINKEEVFDSHWDYIYRRKSTLKRVRGLRNRQKLVKIFLNEITLGYILLDKQNRNIHIFGEVNDLKTNY